MILHRKFFFLFCVITIALAGLSGSAQATQPPDDRDVAKIREILAKKGPLSAQDKLELADAKRRIAFVRKMGNHKIDPALFEKAISDTARDYYRENGMSSKQVQTLVPQSSTPLRWQGMPTKGDVRIFALLIDFSDFPAANTVADINSQLFGSGISANFPRESLANYYDRASYGQLDLSNGSTLGWYRPSSARADIAETRAGREALIQEAIESFDAAGHDFSQYDNNNDGRIDYFVVIWSGPDTGWGNFWWGYQTSFSNAAFQVDGKRLGKYSWQWEARPVGGTFRPIVVIHETGHALGLPDYYDYDDAVGPRGGVGGLDMMHGNWGDHNCFSKWALDWLTPSVIANTSTQTVTLRDSGTTQDCLVLWPGLAAGNHYSEMFIFQNRHRTANDTGWPSDGILVWHVDATLDGFQFDYIYNNSFTERKLLRLMEADGLEEIENGGGGDAGDFYTAGQEFDSFTTPSSLRYSGITSGVALRDIPTPATSMAVTAEIGPQESLQVTPGGGLASTLEPGGSPTPASMQFVLQNTGSSAIDWTASSTVSWAEVSVSSGTLAAGALATVTVSINATEAANLAGGVYQGEFLFANTTLGIGSYKRKVTLSVATPPPNDNFADATLISGRTGSDTSTNLFASEESQEPKHGGVTNGGKSVWWQWVPDTSGEVTFDTAGSDFDTIMSIYGGRSLDRLTTIGDDDDGVASGGASLLTFTAQAGMPYFIAVDGWDKSTGNVTLNWSQSATAPALLSSILPSARSGTMGQPLTAFGSLINTGTVTATDCSIARPAGETGTFSYQTTTAANVLSGTVDTPVSIAAGGTQNFMFSYTPDRAMNGDQIGLVFDCTNTIPAPSVPGLNRFEISSASGAVPDIITIVATVSNDGIVNIPGNTATGFFTAAAINIGAAGTFTAYADDAGAGLSLTTTICKTDEFSNCESTPASNVSFSLATDEIALLAVFVEGQDEVLLDAANNRLFLKFEEGSTLRGATSVAVRTFIE